MRLETLRAYRHMMCKYGPGRAARLMRLAPSEEREALRILALHENDSYNEGRGKDAARPMERASGPDGRA
jgi:hypothetical protein